MTNGSKPSINPLTSGRVLARNTLWNIFSSIAPLTVAVFIIPFLVRRLGVERFGILSIAWVMIGYFSLFDLGLGRAITRLVAEKRGSGNEEDIPAVVWTGLLLMLVLGITGAVVIILFAPWFCGRVLNIPVTLLKETTQVFIIIGFAIPFVIVSTGLRGFIEAYQRFDLSMMVSTPLGIVTFVGPAFALLFTNHLGIVVGTLFIGRLMAVAVYLKICFSLSPKLRYPIAPNRALARQMLGYGGWITVSNIVGPLMVYLDRFFIGAMLSLAAVAYYTTPYDIVTKLLLIPTALTGVLFPAFSAAAGPDKGYTMRILERGVKYVCLIMLPASLVIMSFASEGLLFWLGPDFARQGTGVLQWITAGVFLNSLAFVPFSFIQAAGRSDMTAKLHLVELPLYLLLVWSLIARHGIEGIAIAWFIRATLDMVLVFILAHRMDGFDVKSAGRMLMLVCGGVFSLAIAPVLQGVVVKIAYLISTLIVFFVFAWNQLLAQDERQLILSPFGIFGKARR